MGMYSYVGDDELEVVDVAGLKVFLKDILSGKNPNYDKDDLYLVQDGLRLNTAEDIDKLNPDDFDFGGMDGWKIIQYWYGNFVMFMRDLAVFIDGEVAFNYETEEEKAILRFKDGEVVIEIGRMEFHESSPESLGSRDEKFKPMDEKTLASLMLRRL